MLLLYTIWSSLLFRWGVEEIKRSGNNGRWFLFLIHMRWDNCLVRQSPLSPQAALMSSILRLLDLRCFSLFFVFVCRLQVLVSLFIACLPAPLSLVFILAGVSSPFCFICVYAACKWNLFLTSYDMVCNWAKVSFGHVRLLNKLKTDLEPLKRRSHVTPAIPTLCISCLSCLWHFSAPVFPNMCCTYSSIVDRGRSSTDPPHVSFAEL